ncbi:EsaB/YukD family protein [Bacillus sp. JCM 19041]|uniref:EsaB/YukD family protein n=1 Tax=Bacillus sp. JCM 19041 TaxID=1460637 RepID=UPI0006CF2C9E
MYITVTIDMHRYSGKRFDLRLSNQYSAKKVVDLVWGMENPKAPRRDGSWIRIQNKDSHLHGTQILEQNGVTNGDRLEIL